MQILTLRAAEKLILKLPDGRAVTLCVADVDRGRVRLGVSAPADVKIRRSELLPAPAAAQARP